jgi:hypothetical protein
MNLKKLKRLIRQSPIPLGCYNINTVENLIKISINRGDNYFPQALNNDPNYIKLLNEIERLVNNGIDENVILYEFLQIGHSSTKGISRLRFRKKYLRMPPKSTKDNNGNYVGDGGGNENKIRVPSLKRSNRTWSNFYRLFPSLKGKDSYRGLKLKKI